ncbi:uncharacterized protein [Dysidea avara]|uniref:uncharacterized protein n=1 Tax=Dysidea avara TaxID=196820 RepID=UPI00331DEC83
MLQDQKKFGEQTWLKCNTEFHGYASVHKTHISDQSGHCWHQKASGGELCIITQTYQLETAPYLHNGLPVANSTREETTVVTYHKKSVDELADTLMFGEQANNNQPLW